MPREKSRATTLRLPKLADAALQLVAQNLGLDQSATIRFLVLEKARALGLTRKAAEMAAAVGQPPPPPSSAGESTSEAPAPSKRKARRRVSDGR